MSVPGVAVFHQGGAAPGSGSGDVTGPGSATDNAVARFDGAGGKTLQNSTVTISDTGNVTFPARILGKQGADVASDANITLGSGNYFIVTGTTTIDTINASGWTSGSVIVLQFAASLTLRHNQIGDFDGLALQGAANLAVGAGDTVTLVYDGTNSFWRQTGYANL